MHLHLCPSHQGETFGAALHPEMDPVKMICMVNKISINHFLRTTRMIASLTHQKAFPTGLPENYGWNKKQQRNDRRTYCVLESQHHTEEDLAHQHATYHHIKDKRKADSASVKLRLVREYQDMSKYGVADDKIHHCERSKYWGSRRQGLEECGNETT